MNAFTPRSQAGQDRFVHALFGDKPGTFIDVGMNHPIEKNNTYALEQIGWRGLLVENDVYCCHKLYPESGRTSPLLFADATKVNWLAECAKAGLENRVTYLSLDVDEASLAVLQNMPLGVLRFDCITIEHDAYSRKDRLRSPQRDILSRAGYALVAANVCDQGQPFEDWWVSPEFGYRALPFCFEGREWSEFFKAK